MKDTCDILGVKFNRFTREEALTELLSFFENGKKNMVFTPNPEIVMAARKDSELMDILGKASLIVPDGIGIVYASKFYKNKIKERVAGYDLVQELLKNIKNTDKTVYFFGGAPKVAEKARAVMLKKHSGIKIIGVHDGYFDADEEKLIIKEINEKKPDVLLVGLGAPKQEKWIYANKDKLDVKILIGVGGSFDVMSGNVKRAPKIFLKLGLEWFYRLITQPTRFVRMLKLPIFMLVVIKERLMSVFL